MRYLMIILIPFLWALSTHATPDKVFIQCSVSQGNGFNWGSTLGWLSETTRLSVQKARLFEQNHPNKKAYIDLTCFNGASSASFVAALFDQLLDNRQLTGTPIQIAGRKLYNVKQADKIASALHLMSLSTDFTSSESKRFIGSAAKYALGLHPTRDKQNLLGFDFWKPSSDANQVLATVSQWTSAANHIPFTSNQLEFIKSPLFSKRENISLLKKDDFSKLVTSQQEKMKEVRKVIEKYKKPSKYQAFYRKKLTDHLCVSVFLQPAIKSMTIPFAYDDLELAFLCNQKTFGKLIKGKHLKRLLKLSSITKNKVIIGTTQDWGTALNISMREPELLALISGRLNQSHLGIKKAYRFINGSFKKLDTSSPYVVIGGFPEQRMQAWIPYALMLEQKDVYEQMGLKTQASLSIFGKIDIRDRIASFAESTITKYFGGEEKLTHYHAWQDDFCQAVGKDITNLFHFYSMDWNLSSTPAALGNRAHILTAKGINVVRQQTNYDELNLVRPKFLFDAKDDDQFLPLQATACPNVR